MPRPRQRFTVERPTHVAEGESPAVLRRIADPRINLAVWQRAAVRDIEPALASLLEADDAVAGDWHTPAITQIVDELARVSGTRAAEVGFRALAADIVRLSGLFASVAAVCHPRVRLERVEDDGCALFHADSLRLRLLCTYLGPGTQWLENSSARRDQLGSMGRSTAEANWAIVGDPTGIRSVPSWHAAIFKGRGWPGGEGDALIHRSAPVPDRGEYRIRLCIDGPTDCGC